MTWSGRGRRFPNIWRTCSGRLFLFVAFLAVLLSIDWKMTLGCGCLLPLVVWPVGKIGPQDPAFRGKQPKQAG